MTDLSDALAAPKVLHYAGADREVKPLSFNNLIKIEDRFGDLSSIDFDKARNQRFLVYVILSATDDSLTEESVGELLTFANLAETTSFIQSVFKMSGLFPEEDAKAEQGGDAPKNAKAAKTQPAKA